MVDEAIVHLDTPTEPWSIEVEVRVAGRLRDRLHSLSVPLAESPPFRLRLAHHPGGDVVLMDANHVAFDGVGCIRLPQSVARAYAGQPDPLPDVDLSDARDVERHLGADDEGVEAKRLGAIAEKLRDAVRAPARVAPDGGDDESGYRIVHRSFRRTDETARVDARRGARAARGRQALGHGRRAHRGPRTDGPAALGTKRALRRSSGSRATAFADIYLERVAQLVGADVASLRA